MKISPPPLSDMHKSFFLNVKLDKQIARYIDRYIEGYIDSLKIYV